MCLFLCFPLNKKGSAVKTAPPFKNMVYTGIVISCLFSMVLSTFS